MDIGQITVEVTVPHRSSGVEYVHVRTCVQSYSHADYTYMCVCVYVRTYVWVYVGVRECVWCVLCVYDVTSRTLCSAVCIHTCIRTLMRQTGITGT